MQILPQFICQLNKIFSNLEAWSICHCPATAKAALEGQLRSWRVAVERFLNLLDGQQIHTCRCSKEDILMALVQCYQPILMVLMRWCDIEQFMVKLFVTI